LITLISGFILGAVSFLIDLPVFGTEKIITHKLGIPFMMQAWWMFCLCSLIFVVVSFLTPKPDLRQVEAMTWKNPLQVIAGGRIRSLSDPRLWASVLLLAMAVLYFFLR
jgi:SSS family solute:Na+ symporter